MVGYASIGSARPLIYNKMISLASLTCSIKIKNHVCSSYHPQIHTMYILRFCSWELSYWEKTDISRSVTNRTTSTNHNTVFRLRRRRHNSEALRSDHSRYRGRQWTAKILLWEQSIRRGSDGRNSTFTRRLRASWAWMAAILHVLSIMGAAADSGRKELGCRRYYQLKAKSQAGGKIQPAARPDWFLVSVAVLSFASLPLFKPSQKITNK